MGAFRRRVPARSSRSALRARAYPILAGATAGMALVMASGVARAQVSREVAGELLVKMRPSTSSARARGVLGALGADPLDEIPRQRLHRIRVASAARDAVRSALERNPDVAFVEGHRLFPPTAVPDDPSFGLQWHHATLQSAQAWDRNLAVGQIVAILDSGVDMDHPDLADAILPGWDFWDDDANPSDPNGHGTRVAGVAAAVTHNAKGVAGMAWGAAILPVRVAGSDGWASSWSIAQGLAYAATQGARVANLSFDLLAGSQTVLAAAQAAVEDGVVVVASAGNCGCTESFPDTPWLLSVAATKSNDALASFSSRGAFVDLAAPGQGIQTTLPGGGYGAASGTSFSAPLVTGLVALLQAAEPALTPAQVEARLVATAVDLGAAGWDSSFGHGRVDAAAALAPPPVCGLGAELAFLLPLLMALRRARSPAAFLASVGYPQVHRAPRARDASRRRP